MGAPASWPGSASHDQNIVLSLADVAGTSCTTSQCSTIFVRPHADVVHNGLTSVLGAGGSRSAAPRVQGGDSRLAAVRRL